MYGDPDVMRRRATQLREQAADLRALADQLVVRTRSPWWTGRAADAMRERITERAADVRTAADRHETAADSLERHLRQVEDLREAIATAERRAGALVAERSLPGFTPPPPGHKDWLTATLPGL